MLPHTELAREAGEVDCVAKYLEEASRMAEACGLGVLTDRISAPKDGGG